MTFANPTLGQVPMPSTRPTITAASWRPAAGALGLLVALAGTAQAANASGHAAASAAAPDKAAVRAERPSGKANASGVTVRYEVPEKIALGETVTLLLHFGGIHAAEGAGVEVRDPSTQTTLLSMHLPAGASKPVPVTLVARTDGLQYLDVVTTQGGRSSVRSIPLRVGSGQVRLKTEGQRRSTATGEAVISLPSSR